MKVIVLDKNLRKLREHNGEMKNGVFCYKEGGILGFFGKDKSMPLDYEHTIDIGNGKQGMVWFDGKDYHQIPLNKEKLNKESINDYEREFKITELALDSQVQAPIGLKEIVGGLTMLGLIIAVFAFTNSAGTVVNHLNQTIKPFIIQQQQNTILIHYLENLTTSCINGNNATIAYFKAHTIQSTLTTG